MIKKGLQVEFPFIEPQFPQTRYQGSKQKIMGWIWDNLNNLQFESVLDAFGGTGCVSYMFKMKGKKVRYNDILKFNFQVGKALIENDETILTYDEIDKILTKRNDIFYPSFIKDNFRNIYYTDEENEWLDIVVTNIMNIDNEYKRAIAYFALYQSCIIKRPFNLFHRNNLYIRTSDVKRNFGNKTTWEGPFDLYFKKFAAEANAAIFSNGNNNTVSNMDVFEIEGNYDLVYIDTPYISNKGTSVDYYHFYHFLEGLTNYNSWPDKIDYKSKNKRLKNVQCVWNNKNEIANAFDMLFNKFKNSILVVSYRSDGIPSINEIQEIMSRYKTNIVEHDKISHKYVLSHNHSHEVLIIGR